MSERGGKLCRGDGGGGNARQALRLGAKVGAKVRGYFHISGSVMTDVSVGSVMTDISSPRVRVF